MGLSRQPVPQSVPLEVCPLKTCPPVQIVTGPRSILVTHGSMALRVLKLIACGVGFGADGAASGESLLHGERKRNLQLVWYLCSKQHSECALPGSGVCECVLTLPSGSPGGQGTRENLRVEGLCHP